MEKLWNRLVVGLRQYADENGFAEVLLGLSGGLDSAIVAVLATEALGAQNVHAVMMKTKFTSPLSLDIAEKIASLNGFDYKEIDIEPIIAGQRCFFADLFGQEPKNVVLENLQARERGKILMAISNQFNYLVLACGNKSEAFTGYCTLYGDTCGGLMPIGNVYKSTLFELAKWRNLQSLVLPPEVIERAPSAELSAGQKDEDSLPPYKILDAVLQRFVDEHCSEEQIVALGYDQKTVHWVIDKYKRTAFKREQMPQKLA